MTMALGRLRHERDPPCPPLSLVCFRTRGKGGVSHGRGRRRTLMAIAYAASMRCAYRTDSRASTVSSATCSSRRLTSAKATFRGTPPSSTPSSGGTGGGVPTGTGRTGGGRRPPSRRPPRSSKCREERRSASLHRPPDASNGTRRSLGIHTVCAFSHAPLLRRLFFLTHVLPANVEDTQSCS